MISYTDLSLSLVAGKKLVNGNIALFSFLEYNTGVFDASKVKLNNSDVTVTTLTSSIS